LFFSALYPRPIGRGFTAHFANIKWTAGFDSKFDMTTFELDICDNCMNLYSSAKSQLPERRKLGY
jgi:hypothetical protein